MVDRDEALVAAASLAAYVSALYPPGLGPRTESVEGLEAWCDLVETFGLSPADFKRQALAFSLSHPGRWDAAAFAKGLLAAKGGGVGDAWAEACAWVSDLTSGPVYRGGMKLEAPSMADFLKRPDKNAMARAVQALGLEAIRNRRPEDEGTLRAQFRKFYEEAQAGGLARAAAGLPLEGATTEALPGGRVLQLPDLRADRRTP